MTRNPVIGRLARLQCFVASRRHRAAPAVASAEPPHAFKNTAGKARIAGQATRQMRPGFGALAARLQREEASTYVEQMHAVRLAVGRAGIPRSCTCSAEPERE